MWQRLLDALYALAGYLKGYMDARDRLTVDNAQNVLAAERAVRDAADSTHAERLSRLQARGLLRGIPADKRGIH